MIRIFIVDEDPGVLRSVKDMVDMEKDIKVVGEGVGDRSVAEAVEKTKPHIVLLDAGNMDRDVVGLATSLQTCSSRPALITTSDLRDMGLIRRSMMAGARDHLIKPFEAKELTGAIRNVFEASGVGLANKAKLLGFLGCRGGSGNTTVALSLAGAAVRKGLRVAVVDGNLALGDASFLLNASTDITWTDWSKDSSSGEADPRKYLARSAEGIDVLSAPLNPAQAELVKVDSISRMLNALRDTHELIIADIANNFDEVTLELTENVQDLCLVSDPSLTGIKNLRLIWDLIEQLRFPHEKRSVILNRVQRQDQRTVKETTKDYPSLLTLPIENRLEQGWLRGETPSRVFPRSPFTKAVNRFLDTVLSPEGVD